jgi:hypothetical protein
MEGIRVRDGASMTASEFFTDLVREAPEQVPRIVAETRRNFVRDMCALLKNIRPPKLLLWFSVRKPEYPAEVALPLWKLWGAFPQFVNRPMVDMLRAHSADYVEVVTSRGLPQPLRDRAGNPATVVHAYGRESSTATQNTYYPSPEMHEDAAEALDVPCRKLLAHDSAAR